MSQDRMLRLGTPQDLTAIRDLQIASWQKAYQGILPAQFLTDNVPTILDQRWADWPGPDWRVFIACQGENLIGFLSLDLAHDGGGFVDNLHVAGAAQGAGVGRSLMVMAAQEVRHTGLDRLWLTVIRENEAARAFYSSIGGGEEPGADYDLFGQMVQAIPVAWTDKRLTVLADLARA